MVPGAFFVYGTLMPGQSLWPALEPYAASWGAATAQGRMWDTGRGYPAVRFGPAAGDPVPGVLVAIAPGRLAGATAALDHIEEVGVLYCRVEVATSGGPAMAYEWLGPTADLAPLTRGWPRADVRRRP